MKNKLFFLKLPLLILILVFFIPLETSAQSAIVPINITVNGTLTISDANNDTKSGKDPTLNVNLNITPDLGASGSIGGASFRIRTNRPNWRLTTQRTQEIDTGPTNIVAMDIALVISTQAGSNANATAGTLVAPFNASTDLNSVPVSSPVTVVSGTAKTSSARDSTNTSNYFQVNTIYGIAPDFFFQPGTWKTTITYNLVSP